MADSIISVPEQTTTVPAQTITLQKAQIQILLNSSLKGNVTVELSPDALSITNEQILQAVIASGEIPNAQLVSE